MAYYYKVLIFAVYHTGAGSGWNDAKVVISGWPKYIDELYYLQPE